MSNPIWRLNKRNFNPAELTADGVGKLVSEVLAGRFRSSKDAYDYISADKRTIPSAIPELKDASRLVIRHTRDGKILVSGDYDADGICATAMLVLWLRRLGGVVDWYLPDRSIGYGFNRYAVEKATEAGTTLIIAVDSGTNDIEACAEARARGIEVIVVDHHEPMYGRPPVACFVNPEYYSGQMKFTGYCAAGLVYKLIEEIGQELKMRIPPEMTVLAAVATVADIMPLEHENRYIVKQGLELWPLVSLPGITALRDVLELDTPDAQSIGYIVAPCINAPGRLGSPDVALEMFIADDVRETYRLAERLVELNQERRRLVAEIKTSILERLSVTKDDRIIVVSDENIPHGIAGLVAGHLCSHYGRPAIVLGEHGDAWKGSGRAPGGYDLIDALRQTEECLASYGGHKQAVGVNVYPDKVDTLRAVLNKILPLPKPPAVNIDAVITAKDAGNMDEIAQLKILEPYGCSNPQPVFLIRRANPACLSKTNTGEHIRFRLDNTWFIWFGGGDTYSSVRKPWDIALTLDINNYNDRLEPKGIVQAVTQHISLSRNLIGIIYEAIYTNRLNRIAGNYAEVLQPALATLEELDLISYKDDSIIINTACEKKDLHSSGIYMAYTIAGV